jgi:hypothetical protein
MKPTLRLMLSADEQRKLSVREVRKKEQNLINFFFDNERVLGTLMFVCLNIQSVTNNINITDFAAMVVGRYKIDGQAYLVLSTGDVVALKFFH